MKKEEEKKNSKIEIMVTVDEKEQVKKLASLSGKSTMSAFVLSKIFQKRKINKTEVFELLNERKKIQEQIDRLEIERKKIDQEIINLLQLL